MGTFYKVTPDGNFTLLASLSVSMGQSHHPLVLHADGNFYGTSGMNVIRAAPDGQMSIVRNLGAFLGGLALHSDGWFYGFTPGTSAWIYRINAANEYRVLHRFADREDGNTPADVPLLSASDGNLYGATTLGGNGRGAYYRITPWPDAYSAWRATNWPAGTPDEIAGPAADPDADGFANVLEYGLGLDPNVKSIIGTPQMVVLPGNARALQWTFTRPRDRSDVAVRGEFSIDMTTWSRDAPDITTIVSANDNFTETVTVAASIAGPTKFVRIRAVK
jgi:hypothetical protein